MALHLVRALGLRSAMHSGHVWGCRLGRVMAMQTEVRSESPLGPKWGALLGWWLGLTSELQTVLQMVPLSAVQWAQTREQPRGPLLDEPTVLQMEQSMGQPLGFESVRSLALRSGPGLVLLSETATVQLSVEQLAPE
jgi:hypothetical protein